MSEKEVKSGGAAQEKKCVRNPFDRTFAVTKYELRYFANMMNAMARAAGAYEIDPEPQEVIIPFRICDLKIIDDVKPVEQSDGTWFDKVVGCLITPNDLDRGRWYCLCNDTDDGMHVKFTPGEISPADFYIDQGATVAIYVSGEKIIMDGDYNPKWHEYTIWRVMPDGEVLCSGDSGPGMKVQDPPPG